jgi:hypothetical protein
MAEEPKVRTAFTKDERGILNNWAIEPKMYFDDKVEKKGEQKGDDRREEPLGTTKLLNGRLPMIGITLIVLAIIGITLISIA